MSRNQRLLAIAGVIVSAIFLWIAFSGLNPTEVLGYIGQVEFGWLLVGIGVYVLAMVVITWRWQFLLNAIKRIPLPPLFELVAIGYTGNNIYPFRSGDILRAVLLQRDHAIPIARAGVTVLVERVFDGLVMLTFIIVPLLFVEVASPELRTVATVAAPVFVGALVVFLFLAAQPNLLRRLVRLVVRVLPGRVGEIVTGLSEDVIGGLEGLRSPKDLAGTVFASYLTWAIEAGVYWIVSFAFGLDVGYPVMLIAVGVVNLAGLIPASPGQIGVFEFFASRVLIGVGIGEAQATAYALLVHLVIWLPPTLLGFIYLVRRGLGLRAVRRAQELEAEATT